MVNLLNINNISLFPQSAQFLQKRHEVKLCSHSQLLRQVTQFDFTEDEIYSDMMKTVLARCQKGFTLLELMSVLVILGVLLSVAIKKYDQISNSADLTALIAGIRELNTQESLVWIDMKLSDAGWTADLDVHNAVDKNLGRGYSWNPGPEITGGTLHYGSQSVALVRTASTKRDVGLWN